MDHLSPSKIPKVSKNAMLILGIIDFLLFGVGTIILGIMKEDLWCVIIGVLQVLYIQRFLIR